MLSQDKLLEHLEPVIFTAIVCLVIFLLENYYGPHIWYFWERAIQASPLPRLGQLLEPHITGTTLYVNQLVESIDYWGTRQQRHRQQEPMASVYTLQRVPDVSSLEIPIKPLSSFTYPSAPQYESPLLDLPTEIIDVIASYVLTPYQDLTKPYDFHTCYRRPGNLAPTKTSTAVLQTCQFFYGAYWYLPWTLSTHAFYLASSDRRPERTTTVEQMTRTSHLIAKLHADAPARRKEVSHVQVFPQLYALENGQALSQVLKIPHFMPRVVTITIRHTDWWFWESDTPMSFHNTAFVANARFPISTTTVNMELESLERRRPQVDWMADQMARNWHFTRSDNNHLVADPAHVEAEQWKGAATWGGERWVRDESDAEPNVLAYYVRTVSFRAISRTDDEEGYQVRGRRNLKRGLGVDEAVAAKTRVVGGVTSLPVQDIKRAVGHGGEGVKASEVVRRVNEMRAEERRIRNAEARAGRRRQSRPTDVSAAVGAPALVAAAASTSNGPMNVPVPVPAQNGGNVSMTEDD